MRRKNRHFLFLPEIQNHPVDAIPEPGRRRPVIEYMAKMRFAAPAHHLRSVHPIGMIRCINDAPLGDGLVETGPTAAALELGIAAEKGVAAGSTIIGPDL